MRESSQIRPNQSFPPSRAARRFGLRFAFSNARPPLPPPRAAFCETRPNFGCIVVKPRGAGALVRPRSCASHILRTFQRGGGRVGFRFARSNERLGPSTPRAGHRARLVQDLAKICRWPARAALIRPRSCGRPCFATGYFRFAPIAHILRTIQRDGRDAVGLRLPKPSAAVSRLS